MRHFTRLLQVSIFMFIISQTLMGQVTSSGWVSTIAGSGNERVNDITTDQQGNVYTIGSFSSTVDFNAAGEVSSISSKGESDVFVSKHSIGGDLLWVATFGGTKSETGFSVDVNSFGEVYAVGTFEEEADFDPSGSGELLVSNGDEDIFIAKLSDAGSLIWVKQIGGSNLDEAFDIAIDQNDDLYVVGRFVTTVDFDPGSGTANLQASGPPDAFVLKLDIDGEFIWALDYGSGSSEQAEAVEIDPNNNVVVSGIFSGTTDFEPGLGVTEIYGDGNGDPYYLKLSPEGELIWVKTFTSTGFVYAADIDIDANGDILAHGHFRDDINFQPGNASAKIETMGVEDCFTVKLSSSGEVMWSNILGGANIEFAYGVAVDANGGVYVTGFFYDSVDFDPSPSEFFLSSTGIEDAYIVKYDRDGAFVWAKQVGGPSSESAYGIDIGPLGNILVAGNYWGESNLDPEPGASVNIESEGGADLFILKIDQTISSTKFDQEVLVDLIISPNPSSNSIAISGDFEYPITLSILDANGKEVSTKHVINSGDQQIQIGEIPNGLYHLVIDHSNSRLIKKLVKM